MSSKNNENNNEEKGPSNNNSNSSDKFSFLELYDFLNSENIQKATVEKYAKKKSQKTKKESEKKPELKIKPNSDLAREHTNDDLMYIEKEEDLKKEDLKNEEIEKELKKEKKVEKNIPQKNIEPKKVDRNIVKIDLDKLKNDDKPKKNKEEKELDNKEENKKKVKAINIETILSEIKGEDPQAYIPITLPFEKDKKKEKTLKEELIENGDDNQNKFFIFQFPRQIPIKDLKKQIEIKEQENIKEEPKYDKNGFLQSPEFTNSFKEIKDNTVLGKLVIMKSGKIKIKMGDIYFDINQGSLTKFAQYSTIITEDEENQAYILGQPLNKKLIVTPEFD